MRLIGLSPADKSSFETLIGDIWLCKRRACSQHPLESRNLKFHPVVSAEQCQDLRWAGGGGVSSCIDHCYVNSGSPLRHESVLGFLSCPSGDRAPWKMAAPTRSTQASSLSLPALLLLRDWMLLCGVTNARSEGPGVHCCPTWMCARYAANRHARGTTPSHGDESGSRGRAAPTSPRTSHLHPCR